MVLDNIEATFEFDPCTNYLVKKGGKTPHELTKGINFEFLSGVVIHPLDKVLHNTNTIYSSERKCFVIYYIPVR